MRAQCVLVATTLLCSGAKFHSFLYTGSKTVRVNMESCYGGMSTRLQQRAVTEEGDKFLFNIVTGDASLIHHFDPEEKRLSMQYRHTSTPRPKKIKTMPSASKILLNVFWESQTVYMTEFLEAGNTANSAQYIETTKNLRRRVCRVRRSTSRILLLHDDERPHTAPTTTEALETLKFEVLSHPPYSPDLAPSDFHFFPHLKRDLKGTHFTSDDEVKQAVTSWIEQRTPEFFIDGMRKLV